jgi:hypothetical protein
MNADTPRTAADVTDRSEPATERRRVWMVERTFSEDSPNVLVVVYATPDGSQYLRKEWAYNRFGGTAGAPSVTAAERVEPERLAPVDDPATRERYATEAARMADRHAPDDPV